jgi:hypothetical protein
VTERPWGFKSLLPHAHFYWRFDVFARLSASSLRSLHAFLSGHGTTALRFVSPAVISLLSGGIVSGVILYSGGWQAMRQHWRKDAVIVLLADEQNVYGPAIARFIRWKQDCDKRLEPMKNSVQ